MTKLTDARLGPLQDRARAERGALRRHDLADQMQLDPQTAVMVLNFGEPEQSDPETVQRFLEKIFLANASLGNGQSAAEAHRRSRELAARRAPGLVEEYQTIGGSPLAAQARRQARSLNEALSARGVLAQSFVGMQFTEPSIMDAVVAAQASGCRQVVGLPVYPLCGASTTVAALESMRSAIAELGWPVEVHEISGWHRHPAYVDLRADGIRAHALAHGLALDDPGTLLYFSAHGTPIKYLDAGSRYDRYVEEHCSALASAVGVREYALGYQNHSNRGIPWTEPSNETLVQRIECDRVIVVPISFMHEQSETLNELDIELRAQVEGRGIEFHRVAVPHGDPRFPELLADLVLTALGQHRPEGWDLGDCRCRPGVGTRCLNSDPAAL